MYFVLHLIMGAVVVLQLRLFPSWNTVEGVILRYIGSVLVSTDEENNLICPFINLDPNVCEQFVEWVRLDEHFVAAFRSADVQFALNCLV